jgi:hypothetical protein
MTRLAHQLGARLGDHFTAWPMRHFAPFTYIAYII